jgi:hypothetical protein
VRRTGAGLVDVDDELVAESAVQDLVSGGDDGIRDSAVEPLQMTSTVARMRLSGAVRPLIGKFARARAVCTP